jgi:rubredoxin
MPKVEIHLEISVPSEHLDVNQVIALFQEVQAQLGFALASGYLEAIQDQVLNQALGTRWADTPQDEAPWRCPECGSRRGFTRPAR